VDGAVVVVVLRSSRAASAAKSVTHEASYSRPRLSRPRGRVAPVITREDLETMTSRDLHDRAIGTAKAEGDLDWLWHLLRSIPTAEGEVGDLEDSGMDIVGTVSAINGYARADRDLPGTLRSQYVDYLLEHL
jgi:hypothetical protein